MELFGGYAPFIGHATRFDVGARSYLVFSGDTKNLPTVTTEVDSVWDEAPSGTPLPIDFITNYWTSQLGRNLESIMLPSRWGQEHYVYKITGSRFGQLHAWRPDTEVSDDRIRDTFICCHFVLPEQEAFLERDVFRLVSEGENCHLVEVTDYAGSLSEKVDRVFKEHLELKMTRQSRALLEQLFDPPSYTEDRRSRENEAPIAGLTWQQVTDAVRGIFGWS